VEPIVLRRPLRLEPGESHELKMSVEALPK